MARRPTKKITAPETTALSRYGIPYLRFLEVDGSLVESAPAFAAQDELLIKLYAAMKRTRIFDAKAIALQRTGRLGTYASALGEEAVGVGVASAMREDDVLLPSFREQAAQLWRGVTPIELLLYWGGDERGSDFGVPREDFPVSIPVASHATHAAGVALAFKIRGENRAAVAVFGDGATSKGDFYEAMNLAGVWRLPVVFVAANNQWAISVPRHAQTAAETIAQKCVAAGISGLQVDGNDVIAMKEATTQALDRARRGAGPTLIEAMTYRLGDHTTVDDASRYRDPAEVEAHQVEEPILRLAKLLKQRGAWSDSDEETLTRELEGEIEQATQAYLAVEPQQPGAMFDYLYEKAPTDLSWQRAAVLGEGRGD